ncbi:MAG: hypothetical protein JNK30_02845 [Phenylobacterium sp.]|uniref:hypothetical protein n=1 Tax=Phenylobacterium sp. TaxID=1871053 RepID=UPI001A5E563B|nr:hypothetical protein [Phenylobacterium sp.]MBL8770295.1 hypothetical protein [Phenylobacterium sp.]
MMLGHQIDFRARGLPRALYTPVGAGLCLAVLILSLSPAAEPFLARLMIFYGATTLAYAMMPYVRRGDIPLVAAWVILFAELAPCFTGQLISPVKVAADGLGVLMAAAPVYVARLRQVQQGDTRPAGRRAGEPD